jgi:bacteriocin-like protein
MGAKALSEFRNKLAADLDWQSELRQRAGIGDADGIPSGVLVEFGASKGFAFGIDDLLAARSELSEEELASVSGGLVLNLASVGRSAADKGHEKWIELVSFGQLIRKVGG